MYELDKHRYKQAKRFISFRCKQSGEKIFNDENLKMRNIGCESNKSNMCGKKVIIS